MDNFSLTNFEKQLATVFGPITPEHVAVTPAKSAASSEAATHNLTNQGLLPALHLQDGLNLLDRNFNSLNYFADQAESMFAGLDKDKNGFISQKELSQAIAGRHPSMCDWRLCN